MKAQLDCCIPLTTPPLILISNLALWSVFTFFLSRSALECYVKVLVIVTATLYTLLVLFFLIKNKYAMLHYRNSEFVLFCNNKQEHPVTMTGISRLSQLAYVLRFRFEKTASIRHIWIWKSSCPQGFWRFLGQVHQFGLPYDEQS